MPKIQYEFLLEAVSPIAHHSESIGNVAVAMRRKIRQPNGELVDVPIITADTMRHAMREASADAMLDAADLLDRPVLTEAALRLLYSGGMITGSQDAVKLDEYHRMCEIVPPLALFGGCVGNRSVAGRLSVSDAELVCEETRHLWPDWLVEHMAAQAVMPAADYLEDEQRVRMDPTLRPHHAGKMLPAAAEASKGRQKARAAATDAKEADATKCTMMPRTSEVVVAGSLFSWRVWADVSSDLELDTLNVAIVAALDAAHVQGVGGKKATGHGRLRPIAAKRRHVPRPRELATTFGDTKALVVSRVDCEHADLTVVGAGGAREAPGALMVRHVAERADALREWLSAVVA